MKKNYKKTIILSSIFICLISISIFLKYTNINMKDNTKNGTIEVHQYFSNRTIEADSIYLSDIEYIKGNNQSYTKYDQIRYDQVDVNGTKISLKIENGTFSFKKGIWAHANSQVTYDISSYDYKYFTTFIGLNTTSTRGDGVRFYVFTSVDGQNWGEAKHDEVKLPGEEASFIKIELGDANYIRLIANQIAGNAADHSVYADAKLVNDISENESIFKTVEEYDKIIQSQYNGQLDLTGEIEFNILKRQLINNVGKFTINSFYNESDDNKKMLD